MMVLLSARPALLRTTSTTRSSLFPDFSLGGFGNPAGQPAKFSAEYEIPAGSNEGEIRVTVDLSRGWHIYSLTQEAGGPIRTKLSIESPDSVKLIGDFQPDQPPLKSVSELFKGVTIEEHADAVVWSAPIRVPDGFDDEIVVLLDGQVCEERRDSGPGGSPGGGCIPLEEKIAAKRVGSTGKKRETAVAQAATSSRPFREAEYVVDWTATASSGLEPGQSGVLKFTAKPDAGFHVYVASVDDAQSSTNFVVTEKDGLLIGAPTTKDPVVTQVLVPALPPIKYHQGKVTWMLPIKVPEQAGTGTHTIEGFVAYQACKEESCLPPVALKFTATVVVGEGKPHESAIQLVSAKAKDAFDAAATTKWVDQIEAPAEQSSLQPDATAPGVTKPTQAPPKSSMPFGWVLLFAFIGGVILNVMPCVLPVVGLKIMSFVQQAGEDRRRILTLNIVYVVGILSVFAILAVLAVALSFSWGEQFTYFPVKFGLTLLLFALALELPGRLGNSGAGHGGGQRFSGIAKSRGLYRRVSSKASSRQSSPRPAAVRCWAASWD